MRIDVVDLPDIRLAGLWHHGAYEGLRGTFAELFPRIDALGLGGLPDSKLVAVYYDDPGETPEAELRSFAGLRVAGDTTIGDLEEVRLPAGTFLRGVHLGSHDLIPAAWTKLHEHLAQSEHTSREAASFEIYVGAEAGAPPEADRTDLHVPIASL